MATPAEFPNAPALLFADSDSWRLLFAFGALPRFVLLPLAVWKLPE
ncbi:MAG: hypothetical protein ACXWZL_02570 [Mycobacterium sp.]